MYMLLHGLYSSKYSILKLYLCISYASLPSKYPII